MLLPFIFLAACAARPVAEEVKAAAGAERSVAADCASRPGVVEPRWLGCAPLAMAGAALDGRQEKMQTHPDYLVMATPYAPTRELLSGLETRLGRKLQDRGESHVTVITPPEFAVLSKRLAIGDIEEIASEESLQTSRLKAVCVGGGRAMVDGVSEETFFLVVQSVDLVHIRRLIAGAYFANGGSVEDFDPEHYYPHVTLGFTKTDLHESQGVIKSEESCRFPVAIK